MTVTNEEAPGMDGAKEPGGHAFDAGSPMARYQAYIRSEGWRSCPARLAELVLSGRRCRLCGRGEPTVSIEVHHNSYARLGHEIPQDLCTLCSDCHVIVTTELRRRRYAMLTMPRLSDVPRILPDRILIDRMAEFDYGDA